MAVWLKLIFNYLFGRLTLLRNKLNREKRSKLLHFAAFQIILQSLNSIFDGDSASVIDRILSTLDQVLAKNKLWVPSDQTFSVNNIQGLDEWILGLFGMKYMNNFSKSLLNILIS